jgi:hypothetical protein
MNSSYSRRIMLVMIVVITILILTPGFYRNEWQAAGRKLFYDWRANQERMVMARLIQSRATGVLSYGALLGFGNLTTWDPDSPALKMDVQQVYLDHGKFESYFPYTSNSALQGVFFGLFDDMFGLRPKLNLNLFHGAESVLSASMFGLLIYWVIHELGWTAGLFTLVFVAFSEWITLFAGNIYWNLWAFYLPLIAVSFYLMITSAGESYNLRTMSAILVITILIKCLFTGFEYITTALIMPLVPFIFYAVRDSWGWPKLFVRLIKSSLSLLAGVVIGLLTLTWQIMQIKGSFREAVATILDALGKRTYGDPTQYSVEAESLRAHLGPVLMQYIHGRAILLTQILHIKGFAVEVNYLTLFILFMTFTGVLIVLMKPQVGSGTSTTALALILTTWISALAPLSWFILFKAHSFVHTQMNFIIWQMPFTLYGFALCGYTLGAIVEEIRIKQYSRLPNRI